MTIYRPPRRRSWRFYLTATVPALVAAVTASTLMLLLGLPVWFAVMTFGSIAAGAVFGLILDARRRKRTPR